MAKTIDEGDLEIGLLRTFLALIEHGSTGRAAKALAMTQPAVSQRILRLEQIIGRQLFSRSRYGVKLTSQGEVLVAYANRAIDLNGEALARLRQESASGPVRLGVSEEAALAGLTPALKRFQRTYPDVELNLTVAGPARLEFLLTHGELDFIVNDPARMFVQPSVEWKSQLAWFASADMSIDPFCPLPLVLSQNAGSWRDQILDSLRGAGWAWRIVMENASLDTTIAAVESGLGVSALLRDTVRNAAIREVAHGKLPGLPETRFGLFRANLALTRAQSLMEAALVTSLRSDKTQRVTLLGGPQAWLANDETKAEPMTVS